MAPRQRRDAQVLTLKTLGAWGLESAQPTEPSWASNPSKGLALLVYLACSPGATARRERLVDLLWADMEPEAGDHALRQVVLHLRKRLGDACLRSDPGSLSLACPFECDCSTFLDAIERQDFETAVRAYGGDFLPGFAAPGGAEFERWADLERQRLRNLFLLACESLARRWLTAGRFREAATLARRARDTDRENEAGWRLFLEALAASGDSVSTAVEAEELRRSLSEERRTPEPATTAAIRRALHEQAQARPDRGATLVTELVGREREFTAITAAWEAVRGARGRHVHITGAAGLGKTRLLHDVATRLRASGAAVVKARANPGERQVRFALVAELAATLADLPGSAAVGPASADALVSLDPRLSNRYATATRVLRSQEDLSRVFMLALVELVEALSDEAPVAILIDDVHWADADSRGLIAAALARFAERRVLLVTSARPEGEGRLETGETSLLTLEPLTPDQVALLVAGAGALPEAAWASEFARALHRTTLGSPLLIVETLRLALGRDLLRLSDGEWSSPDPVALFQLLAQGGALHQRIVDLSRDNRWVMTLLATAGMPLDQPVICEAVTRDAAAVAASLDELYRLGLATRAGESWMPGHDAIAEKLLEIAPPEQRAAAHAALGKALAAHGDATSLRTAAHHLSAASLEGELTPIRK